MIRGTKILLLFLLGSSGNLMSQQLSHQVLVPIAGVSLSGNISYSQTIGESAVEIFEGSDHVFTHGFQQPSIKFLQGGQPEGNGVDVFPNPAIENITVRFFGNTSRDFIIEMINMTGNVVFSEKQSFTDSFYLEKVIPVSSFYKGIYLVRILSTDKLINRTFKIEKL
jgi:hypothetical protein